MLFVLETIQPTKTVREGQNSYHPIVALSAEFGELAERHRGELLVHCYRMLGSLLDAEDLVQETLLRAWRGLDTFQGRSSIRAWLYRVATNACLNALEVRRWRSLPQLSVAASAPTDEFKPPTGESIWLEPLPDSLAASDSTSPEGHYDAVPCIVPAARCRGATSVRPSHRRIPPLNNSSSGTSAPGSRPTSISSSSSCGRTS
jgi:RNA polymerase sigma factor (sigma-70 family)